MNPKISVIVPVYNVEMYLEQCLKSILCQSIDAIEVICVNDGSTDESGSILERFAKKDERVKVLTQENAGAGAARNLGMKEAKGDYLSFLDSDDFFNKKMFEKAYSRAKDTSAEIVCFRSDRFYEEEKRFENAMWTINAKQIPNKLVFSASEIRPNIYLSMKGWAWDKLFSHSFIQNQELLFQEIKIHNDLYFVYSALTSASKISVLDDVLVHQRKITGGTLSSLDVRVTAFDNIKDALVKTLNRIKSHGQADMFKRDFINYTITLLEYHLFASEGNIQEQLFNLVKNEWLDLFSIPKYSYDYFYKKEDYDLVNRIIELPYKKFKLVYDS